MRYAGSQRFKIYRGSAPAANIVQVPNDYDPNKPYRLVFAWHGLGGTAMQIASNFYGLTRHSANSAIFIAGQGLKMMPQALLLPIFGG